MYSTTLYFADSWIQLNGDFFVSYTRRAQKTSFPHQFAHQHFASAHKIVTVTQSAITRSLSLTLVRLGGDVRLGKKTVAHGRKALKYFRTDFLWLRVFHHLFIHYTAFMYAFFVWCVYA